MRLSVSQIAQLHSTKFKLRFCTGSNPGRSVSDTCNSRTIDSAENKTKRLSLVNYTVKEIHHRHYQPQTSVCSGR